MDTKKLSDSHWPKAALAAYAGYIAKGRGVLHFDAATNSEQYLGADELSEAGLGPALRLTNQYDPATQLVYALTSADGRTVPMIAENPAPAKTPKELFEAFAAENAGAFETLVNKVLNENFGGDAGRYDEALQAAQAQRPDLFSAYFAG